jgi:flagellar biosynthesis/type III secretory pathway protein FliH
LKVDEKNKEIMENFRKGYMEGFADGYKQAMMEVIEKRQQMEISYYTTPGIQSRIPKKP